MTDTTDSQQRTIVIVMKQENSTVIIHQNGFEQNYDNENTDYDQSESNSCFDDDNFDHNDVLNDLSEKAEELQYLPEGKADEVEPEPEYDEKEEDYVVGYFSWKIMWAVAILCYILFRYRRTNKLA